MTLIGPDFVSVAKACGILGIDGEELVYHLCAGQVQVFAKNPPEVVAFPPGERGESGEILKDASGSVIPVKLSPFCRLKELREVEPGRLTASETIVISAAGTEVETLSSARDVRLNDIRFKRSDLDAILNPPPDEPTETPEEVVDRLRRLGKDSKTIATEVDRVFINQNRVTHEHLGYLLGSGGVETEAAKIKRAKRARGLAK